MKNRFRILLIITGFLMAAGIGIFSPDSAFSKTIYANVSNHVAMELAMTLSGKSHLRTVQGIVLSITDDSIFIFDRDTNSKQNYIINNETKLYNHRLYRIAQLPNGREKIIEAKRLPDLLRKGYLVILKILPGSNIVRSIKIVEKPQ